MATRSWLNPARSAWSALTPRIPLPPKILAMSAALAPASLAITPLPLGELPAGIWRVSYHARVTTPASVSSSLEVTISWTDGGVSQSATGAAMTGNLTTTVGFGTLPIRIDADTPVSVATIYASTGAQAMIYRLDVVLESLALDGQP